MLRRLRSQARRLVRAARLAVQRESGADHPPQHAGYGLYGNGATRTPTGADDAEFAA